MNCSIERGIVTMGAKASNAAAGPMDIGVSGDPIIPRLR